MDLVRNRLAVEDIEADGHDVVRILLREEGDAAQELRRPGIALLGGGDADLMALAMPAERASSIEVPRMKLAPGLAVSQSVVLVSACSVVPASKISDLMRSAGMAPQISCTPSMKPAMR
jgi:hypothetical protein